MDGIIEGLKKYNSRILQDYYIYSANDAASSNDLDDNDQLSSSDNYCFFCKNLDVDISEEESSRYYTAKCSHQICNSCRRNLFKDSQPGQRKTIKCAAPNCNKNIDENELSSVSREGRTLEIYSFIRRSLAGEDQLGKDLNISRDRYFPARERKHISGSPASGSSKQNENNIVIESPYSTNLPLREKYANYKSDYDLFLQLREELIYNKYHNINVEETDMMIASIIDDPDFKNRRAPSVVDWKREKEERRKDIIKRNDELKRRRIEARKEADERRRKRERERRAKKSLNKRMTIQQVPGENDHENIIEEEKEKSRNMLVPIDQNEDLDAGWSGPSASIVWSKKKKIENIFPKSQFTNMPMPTVLNLHPTKPGHASKEILMEAGGYGANLNKKRALEYFI